MEKLLEKLSSPTLSTPQLLKVIGFKRPHSISCLSHGSLSCYIGMASRIATTQVVFGVNMHRQVFMHFGAHSSQNATI